MNKIENIKIFIVDDSVFCRNLYKQHLKNLRINDIHVFEDGEQCMRALLDTQIKPDVILMDFDMPPTNGLEIISRIRSVNTNQMVVMISSQGSIQVAVDAMKYGVLDYIIKDGSELDRLTVAINSVLENKIHRQMAVS
jgi:DNA-binding NtrC family response regulator